jgi:hypothetical protein
MRSFAGSEVYLETKKLGTSPWKRSEPHLVATLVWQKFCQNARIVHAEYICNCVEFQ